MSTSQNRNILITTSSFGKYDKKPLELLDQAGYTYTLNPHGRKITGDELLAIVGESVGIVAGTEKLDAEVLNKIPQVKAISRCGIGMDNVDLKEAEKLAVKVTNTTGSIITAVAELTVGLILSLLRKTALMDKQLKNGQWSKLMGNLLSGKKVGIIGFGRIGQAVSDLLAAFNTELAYYDIVQKRSHPNISILDENAVSPLHSRSQLNSNFGMTSNKSVQFRPLADLLAWADIVCVHVSKSKDGSFLLDKAEIESMKQGAWVVNCSRGGVVNEDALYESLKNGKLAGAAIDVFSEEPYTGPLTELDNVLLTPHVGSYAKEARVEMEIESVNNLLKSLRG